jgi:hypothetical protein
MSGRKDRSLACDHPPWRVIDSMRLANPSARCAWKCAKRADEPIANPTAAIVQEPSFCFSVALRRRGHSVHVVQLV